MGSLKPTDITEISSVNLRKDSVAIEKIQTKTIYPAARLGFLRKYTKSTRTLTCKVRDKILSLKELESLFTLILRDFVIHVTL